MLIVQTERHPQERFDNDSRDRTVAGIARGSGRQLTNPDLPNHGKSSAHSIGAFWRYSGNSFGGSVQSCGVDAVSLAKGVCAPLTSIHTLKRVLTRVSATVNQPPDGSQGLVSHHSGKPSCLSNNSESDHLCVGAEKQLFRGGVLSTCS